MIGTLLSSGLIGLIYSYQFNMSCSCSSSPDLFSNGSSSPSSSDDSVDRILDEEKKRRLLERKESYNHGQCALQRQENLAGQTGFQTRKLRDEKMVFGIDKVLSGIVKYHQTVRGGMLEQFKRVRDNPVVSIWFDDIFQTLILSACFTLLFLGSPLC